MKIKYRMTAPVSHIGETASVGSYFQTITTASGKLPVITGNSVRGIIRDAGAKHLLNECGAKVSKETFNVLFSGGNISGTMKLDLERAEQVRKHFPFVSLMGGGLGTMMMQGKLMSGFLYPVCEESAEITGEISNGTSWHNLIDEIEFTRMDDGKNDLYKDYAEPTDDAEQAEKKKGEASTQMRVSVQYMAAGTEFVQNIEFCNGITNLEKGAFYAALCEWFKVPRLGGMIAKGFGTFDAEVNGNEIVLINGKIKVRDDIQQLIDEYNSFIHSDCSENWLYLLEAKK